jgi:hypothetical protein
VPNVGDVTLFRIEGRVPPHLGHSRPWDAAKNEMELNRFIRDGSQFQSNIAVSYYISFPGFPEIERTPAMELLYEFELEVEVAISNVETRMVELGLIAWPGCA